MKVLWIMAVFVFVTVTVTVAALTALIAFWSSSAAQPSTAAALGLLFLGAPGLGIAAGVAMAFRAATSGPGRPPAGVLALLAIPVGLLAGFGGAMAALDLIYADRWSNPESAPAWLPWAPYAAAPVMAGLLVFLVLVTSRPSAKRLPG